MKIAVLIRISVVGENHFLGLPISAADDDTRARGRAYPGLVIKRAVKAGGCRVFIDFHDQNALRSHVNETCQTDLEREGLSLKSKHLNMHIIFIIRFQPVYDLKIALIICPTNTRLTPPIGKLVIHTLQPLCLLPQ